MDAKQLMITRKMRTEKELRQLGIPINPHLPVVESELKVRLRSAEEVAERALILHALLGVIFYESPAEVTYWVQREGLWPAVSPEEREIFAIPLSEEDPVSKAWKQKALQSHRLTWRIESLWVLLWALQKVEQLDLPREQCDGSVIGECMPQLGESVRSFIQGAQLRPATEILNALDRIYRIHWAVVDARLQGKEPPGGFDPGIVYQQHYALNWLTHYCDQEWDEITTDT